MTTLKSITAGFATPDAAHGMSVATAQAIIHRYIGDAPVCGTETVPLRAASTRVLAETVHAPHNVPPFANSAMDGYAFAGTALAVGAQLRLRVVGASFAGHPHEQVVGAGECVRIMTGAMLPPGCDTVVPQELVVSADDDASSRAGTGAGAEAGLGTSTGTGTGTGGAAGTVSFATAQLAPGANRREAGEDLARGQVALPSGRVLRPADVGLAASLGLDRLVVRRKLRVAVFSTGDELRALGGPLEAGCIYDSNRLMLDAALRRLPCETVDLGVAPDTPDALEKTLRLAVEQRVDAVLGSGGVSVGDADFTRQRAGHSGDVVVWQLAMRPGRPFAFGRLAGPSKGVQGPFYFGLPGNPVAALVSYYQLVRDALLAMSGAQPTRLPLVPASAAHALRKRAGRVEYQRGTVSATSDGGLQVALSGHQGSGVLSSISEANCLIVLPPESTGAAAGERVHVLLFDGLF